MSDTARPWDRLPGEPVRWFTRFEAYRLAGPTRSLEAVARPPKAAKGGRKRSPGAWRQAAERWRWRERAEAWDLEQVAVVRRRHEELLAADHAGRLELACRMVQKALEAVGGLIPEAMSPRDIATFLECSTKVKLLLAAAAPPASPAAPPGDSASADLQPYRDVLREVLGSLPSDRVDQPGDPAEADRPASGIPPAQ